MTFYRHSIFFQKQQENYTCYETMFYVNTLVQHLQEEVGEQKRRFADINERFENLPKREGHLQEQNLPVGKW